MQPRAFITGVTGQDGYYLSRRLLNAGYEVHGLVRRCSRDTERQHVPHGVEVVTGDITDPSVVREVARLAPTEIYNLAAMSHVGESFINPDLTMRVNLLGTVHMLDAARLCGARIYQASTSEMFGNSPGPQNERTPLDPQSPYAVAKVAAHHMVRLYREAYDVWACAGILFNHESPRRGADFVTQKVCRAAAAIKAGEQDVLELGNLTARRDWGDARDYVRAMHMMMRQQEPRDYVIATGVSRSITDLLDFAFLAAGISNWAQYVRTSTEFERPADVRDLCGDASLAREQLGWMPHRDFAMTIGDMVRACSTSSSAAQRATA